MITPLIDGFQQFRDDFFGEDKKFFLAPGSAWTKTQNNDYFLRR